MMMRNYKENCPSLWNDMKNEWYVDDDMKNNIVKMKCVLMMRLKWLNDAKDQWLYMRRKKKKCLNLQFPNIALLGNFLLDPNKLFYLKSHCIWPLLWTVFLLLLFLTPLWLAWPWSLTFAFSCNYLSHELMSWPPFSIDSRSYHALNFFF